MKIDFDDEFDLVKTAYSGQCFRWNEVSDGCFRVVAGKRMIHVSGAGAGKLDIDCSIKEYNDFWQDYFDAGTNYSSIRKRIDCHDDPFLFEAAEHGTGIRILRQQPWETLISFIISQRKSIPAIKTAIENLCMKGGEQIGEDEGKIIYSFPDSEEIAQLSDDELKECGLGYRTDYIRKVSDDAVSGKLEIASMQELTDDELEIRLEEIYGVGPKVASCARLFGFHRLDAFPKDVWINRVLDEVYHNDYNFEKYSPYNGIMQQYMFYYYRNKSKNKEDD